MNLIWQFHIDTKRKYDGPDRGKMAYCSASTAMAYAMKVGAAYMVETNSVYYSKGVHGGPAMECLQLIDGRYDAFDYVLFLDTDVLIRPAYRNIFEAYPECAAAGHNTVQARDELVLQSGWLRGKVDPDAYRTSYMHGDIMLLSRRFRTWLRNNVDPMIINEDAGRSWKVEGIELKWPMYEQSMLSYWMTISPYSLTPLPPEFTEPPNFIHAGGKKTEGKMQRFFATYDEVHRDWLRSSNEPGVDHGGALVSD